MTDKGRRDAGTDPTMTPSQAIGEAQTNISSEATTLSLSTAKLPARYAIQRQLGAGGMGEVLLATDAQIGRDVAVKRMRVAPTPNAVARFVREAKVQGRLDHPAIVPVHELANDSEGRPFFVMKRLTGTTLADILGGGHTRTPQKLLRAFADVCLAIEFAHNRGVIHRDLKPSNIMLGDFGEVYVLDWGVARIVDEADDVDAGATDMPAAEATEAGAILGTPGYIAPELIRGEPIDARADVYALGCILFEILAGESMLPRGREALVAALDPFNTRPSTRAPDREVPPELDEACVTATDTARDARQSARQLAETIERYLDGDRDLALRKTLAASHLDAARTALAAGDNAGARATAMREAGRAIALDPQNTAAAELVGRLMLEPPREVPADVEARVAEIEQDTARDKVRLMGWTMSAFLIMIPAVIVIGVRSYLSLVVFGALVVLNVGLNIFYVRRRVATSRRTILISAYVFAALVMVMSRVYTPFLLAPTIAAIALIMFSVDPRVPWRLLTAVFTAAVLLPWLAEYLELIPRTTSALDGSLVMRADAVKMSFPVGAISLALFVISVLLVAGFIAHQIGLRQREAIRSVELQAWHLRQLVKG
ncbi:MAG TPA: serine/threonine-protein kinase [Kofleriaceae bacterium]